jgi:hypothetical protein
MLLMRSYPLRWQVGGGWALEIQTFCALWNGIEPLGECHLRPKKTRGGQTGQVTCLSVPLSQVVLRKLITEELAIIFSQQRSILTKDLLHPIIVRTLYPCEMIHWTILLLRVGLIFLWYSHFDHFAFRSGLIFFKDGPFNHSTFKNRPYTLLRRSL